MERSTALVAFERLNSRVSVEVHFKRLSPRKLFPAHFANEFTFVVVGFGVTVAIPDA